MRYKSKRFLLLATVLCAFLLGHADNNAQADDVFGWVEPIVIMPGKMRLLAKLDSGAKTSSIDATNIERFQNADKENWVRFQVESPDAELITIERKVVRSVRIKKKGGGYQHRPVVLMGVCVDDHYIEGEMNLAKRSNFNYAVLLGRNMMAGKILIDPAKRNTSTPDCEL